MKTTGAHDIKIVHIMKDGEVRDSIEGLVPPAETGCYEIMMRIIRNHEGRNKQCC